MGMKAYICGREASGIFLDHLNTIRHELTSTKLVNDKQRIGSGGAQHRCCLQHLRHEGGHARERRVRRTDPGEYCVPKGNGGPLAGHKAANLGHKDSEARLTDVSRLPAHIRTRDDVKRRIIAV